MTAPPTLGRVIRQDRWGDGAVLEIVDVEVPSPLPSEILVRVQAAGVNPIDVFTREGLGYAPPISLPFRQGWDVAGVVEAVGFGVTRFAVGDEVFGMPWFPREAGAYGDFVVAPSRQFARKPVSLDVVEAAGLPMAGLTAWQMVIDTAHVQAGDRVLVTGASGGVGHLAVQLAQWRGATVIGVARKERHDFLRSLDLVDIVDPQTQSLREVVDDIDVAIDLVAGPLYADVLHVLKPGGHLVSALASAIPTLSDDATAAGVRASAVLVEPDGAALEQLATLIDRGELSIHVGARFPLERAADAHHAQLHDRPVGKIVLTLDAKGNRS